MFSPAVSQRLKQIKAKRQEAGRLQMVESMAAYEHRLDAAEARAEGLGCRNAFRTIRYVASNVAAELDHCGILLIYVDYSGSDQKENARFLWTIRTKNTADSSPIVFSFSEKPTYIANRGQARPLDTDDVDHVASVFLDVLERQLPL